MRLSSFYLLCFLLMLPILVQGQERLQDYLLAKEYLQQEQYEKAAPLFESLYDQDPDVYYKEYLQTLIGMEEYKDARKLVQKQQKRDPARIISYIELAMVYEAAGEKKDAEKEYQKALEYLPADKRQILVLSNAFLSFNKVDYALQTLIKGRSLIHDPYAFAFELGEIYHKQGETGKMVNEYLELLEFDPNHLNSVKNDLLDLLIADEEIITLEKALYKKIQKNPDHPVFAELLIWHFMQKGDYDQAFLQVKALDKRFNENGSRVYSLANEALREKEFELAEKAYRYLINKGEKSYLYFPARQGLIKLKREKIETSPYADTDLQELEKYYLNFIEDFGINAQTAPTVKDLASFYARYQFNLEKAITLTRELMGKRSLSEKMAAEIKLDLADYYLMNGQRWEATLLYSQVDKAFKDEPIGEKARFKNAKLAYYFSDFEWAEAQLKVLKGSTSELVANDALELSVFISENFALDTILTPMKMYAEADLMIYQNNLDKATEILQKLNERYPRHELADDLLFARAGIELKRRNYTLAAEYLEKMTTEHPRGIKSDNALFMLGNIYNYYLDDSDKALNAYQKLILEYKDSIFAARARKLFRNLRGDQIN